MDCVPEDRSRLTVPLLNEKLPAFTRLPAMITVILAGQSSWLPPEILMVDPNLRPAVEAALILTVFPLLLPKVTTLKLLDALLLVIRVLVLPVNTTLLRPMATEDPEANSQLPETWMPPEIDPVMDDPLPQVMLTTLRVVEATPVRLNEPLMIALPEAVSIAWFVIVLLIVRDAPVLIVRLLHTGVKEPLMTGWLDGADGMVT